MSNRSRVQRWELAALFGSVLAARAAKADVVAFQSTHQLVVIPRGASILRAIDLFRPFVGGGTETFQALAAHYAGHDRVVILTDEQAFAGPLPEWRRSRFGGLFRTPAEDIRAPIYTFNLAGYRVGHLPSGTARRYTFGGLSDRGFAAIALLERGFDVNWSQVAGDTATAGAIEEDAEIEERE
jgi:hypothetical protein